jgi:multimeric flavodoxin WrbA
MKVLGISTSPRRKQNTEKLVEKVLEGSASLGAETELYTISGKHINPCTGCDECRDTKKSVINDDMQELYNKIIDADGIVIGTPVYFYDMTAQCKTIIDRTIAIEPINGNKVGGIVTVAGSAGLSDVVKNLSMYFGVQGITPAGWVAVYSPIEDKIKAQEFAFELGAKIVKMLNAQKTNTTGAYNQLNHFAYGTHTL